MQTWGVIDGLLSDLGAGTSWEAPSQYADTHAKVREFEPERRLWAAVYEMALKDWRFSQNQGGATISGCHNAENRKARAARIGQELREWVAAGGRTTGGFEWLSEALGLNPDAVRAALLSGKAIVISRCEPRRSYNGRSKNWRDYMRRYRREHPEVRTYNRNWMRRHRSGEFV